MAFGLLAWPFLFVKACLTGTLRVIGASLGTVLMAIGLLLCCTIVMAWLGVPLTLLGLFLLIKSFFG